MVRRGGLLRGCGRGRNSRFPLDALPGLPRRVAARGEAPGEASPRDRRGRVERTVHGSGRIPRRIAEGRASAPYFYSSRLLECAEFRRGSCPLRASIGADRRGALIEDADFPSHFAATASLPRTNDQREREPNAVRAAPVLRHSHPRKKELAARAPARQARPLEPVLDDPETPHNEARGCECPSMHLGARRAPTAETLTRHLFRSLSLSWISPPFPGGTGAGGKGRGAAAPLGAPFGSSPCAEYVRGRIIRARSPACLRGTSKPRETGAGVRALFPVSRAVALPLRAVPGAAVPCRARLRVLWSLLLPLPL